MLLESIDDLINSRTNFSRSAELQAPVAQPAPARHVQSPAERKKDIVAQAMQEQKIFEENIPKAEPVVKQEPGVAAGGGGDGAADAAGKDGKPAVTATKTAANSSPNQRKPYQRNNTFNRQQIMPRLQVERTLCFLCSIQLAVPRFQLSSSERYTRYRYFIYQPVGPKITGRYFFRYQFTIWLQQKCSV